MFQRILWLSFAGACGTVSRYALCEAVSKSRWGHYPLGTFGVNIIGCFLFGLLYAMAQKRMVPYTETRVIVLVGFIGAFTTFSAFAFDTVKLARTSQWMLAFGNVFANMIVGIAALAAGVLLVRAL